MLKIKVEDKELKEYHKVITFDDLKTKIVGVDALIVIFESLTNGPILTNKDNKVTSHINTIINKIIRMNGKQIWVFDNVKKVDFKTETIEKRIATGFKTEIFKHIKLSEAIKDIKQVLEYMNIPYITTPPETEAEAYLCEMKRYNLIDYILSRDTDVLAYGFDLLIFDGPKVGFKLYEIKKIMKLLKLKQPEFLKLCIMLGTDFNLKTLGIGFQNMIKNLDMELTPTQYKIFIWFTFRIDLTYENNIDILKNLSTMNVPKIKNNKELTDFLSKYDFKKLLERINT